MTDSHSGQRLPAVVDSYPVDVSPSGIRGMGGNMQDWCLDLFDRSDDAVMDRAVPPPAESEVHPRVLRSACGGAWLSFSNYSRAAARSRYPPTLRNQCLGLRGLFPISSTAIGQGRDRTRP